MFTIHKHSTYKKKKPQEAHTPCGREIGYAGLTLTTGENPDEQPPANNL